MSIALVIFLYATWSSVFSIGKMALEYSPPVFLTGFRMLFAGVILIAYLLIRRKFTLKITKKQWLSIGLLALFSIYLTNILEFWSLQHLTAAKTCFIYSLSPFFAALLSYIHFKEKMTRKKWLGMLVGFCGFIPVLTLQSGSENLLKAFSFFSWPELAMMGAAFFSVYGWVLLRIVVKDSELSPLYANGMSMLIGGLMALANSFVIDSWTPTPIASGHFLSFFQSLFFMTLISNILCYNLYGYLLKKYTATFLSFMGLLSPLFASLNSWILLGEAPSMIIFASTGIVCIGLWIVYSEELKQGYVAKKEKKTLIKDI